jgi:hypothetical protein
MKAQRKDKFRTAVPASMENQQAYPIEANAKAKLNIILLLLLSLRARDPRITAVAPVAIVGILQNIADNESSINERRHYLQGICPSPFLVTAFPLNGHQNLCFDSGVS